MRNRSITFSPRSLNINFYPESLNPYEVLKVPNDASYSLIKETFRNKVADSKDEIRAKLCLAYYIFTTKEKFIDKGNNVYSIKKKDVFYYVTVGDLESLKKEIDNNNKLLYTKDSLKRNLLYLAARNGHLEICKYLINKGIPINEAQSSGSTALHGASFYGHTKVSLLLLNYGANPNIKNDFGNLPLDEAKFPEIQKLFQNIKKDPISSLFYELYSKKLCSKLIEIKKDGKILGKKLICTLQELSKDESERMILNDWVLGWHGTNYSVLGSIVKEGLKAPGEISSLGEIKPRDNHIARNVSVNEVDDWAKAVFVSPSIFYSSHRVYAKTIVSNENTWCVLVETRVRPSSFTSHKSTVKDYQFKEGEPKNVEYRVQKTRGIKQGLFGWLFRIESPRDKINLYVVSVLFVLPEFFEKATKFREGKIFEVRE